MALTTETVMEGESAPSASVVKVKVKIPFPLYDERGNYRMTEEGETIEVPESEAAHLRQIGHCVGVGGRPKSEADKSGDQ